MQSFPFSFFNIAVLLVLTLIGVLADETTTGNMQATPSISVAVPFDHLAQNLPDALSALENQFQDVEFKSVLTSQLNNPNAVEMFQSLIHDQGAISSISALLEDPNIQSSLSAQFVQQYLLPAETNGAHSNNAANSGDVTSHHVGPLDIENSLDDLRRHSSTHSGSSSRPRTLVLGCLLTFLLSALAPM